MNQEGLNTVFDKQAAGYEAQQQKLAPVHDGLYFQLEWIFSSLPATARVLYIFDPGTTSRENVADFMANLATNPDLWAVWKGKMPVIYNDAE